ncbi:MAG: flagellar protein FlbB [Pseudomonadota bacterium]
MGWVFRLRVMPLLVVVAALSFGVRFGEFVSGVRMHPGSASAQVTIEESAEEATLEVGELEVDETVQMAQVDDADGPRTAPVKTDMEPIEPPMDWRDAGDTDFEFSEMRMELFQDLKARRQAIEEQERELSVREALLKAAEQEIDQKYQELLSLRKEIQDLLMEQTEEEKARVASLVKIYEGMKPKDAARIFNSLDLDVLLDVVSKMSERKSAPIIASMDPERARTLTIMLMEQKSLPNLSDLDTNNGFNS